MLANQRHKNTHIQTLLMCVCDFRRVCPRPPSICPMFVIWWTILISNYMCHRCLVSKYQRDLPPVGVSGLMAVCFNLWLHLSVWVYTLVVSDVPAVVVLFLFCGTDQQDSTKTAFIYLLFHLK